jgi:hypothetical protein
VLIAWTFWIVLSSGDPIRAILWGGIPLLICNLICRARQRQPSAAI